MPIILQQTGQHKNQKNNCGYIRSTATILLLVLILLQLHSYAQTPVAKSKLFKSEVPQDVQSRLLQALDTLIYKIDKGLPLSKTNSIGGTLTNSIFGTVKGIGVYGAAKNDSLYFPQLINLHAIADDRYLISIAYIGSNSLKAIIDFEAKINHDWITFSIPLFYLTEKWKIRNVGNITYHYANDINLARAKKFNSNNTRIAEKLGLRPEKFEFYLVDNYQEILKLLGYSYDSETAGHETDGLGISSGYIFSIMHNEDFSHDTFHYYAEKVRTHPRNGAAEEGIAYSWGNAYYTDSSGEMITQKQLVKLLKIYLQQYPNTSLLELFSKNPLIFPAKTKVRSLIASIISDEVERRKGITGIKALIDCGRGDDNYFKVVNELISVNPADFDVELKKLLNKYN